MMFFADALAQNMSVQDLDFSIDYSDKNNQDSYAYFFQMLKANKVLKKLNFSCTFLGKDPKTIEALCQALKINNTLESISLSQIDLGDKSALIKGITEVLKVNKTLKIIDLSYNNLCLYKKNEGNSHNDDEKWKKFYNDFLKALEENENLVHIDFSENFRNDVPNEVKEILNDKRIKLKEFDKISFIE